MVRGPTSPAHEGFHPGDFDTTAVRHRRKNFSADAKLKLFPALNVSSFKNKSYEQEAGALTFDGDCTEGYVMRKKL